MQAVEQIFALVEQQENDPEKAPRSKNKQSKLTEVLSNFGANLKTKNDQMQ